MMNVNVNGLGSFSSFSILGGMNAIHKNLLGLRSINTNINNQGSFKIRNSFNPILSFQFNSHILHGARSFFSILTSTLTSTPTPTLNVNQTSAFANSSFNARMIRPADKFKSLKHRQIMENMELLRKNIKSLRIRLRARKRLLEENEILAKQTLNKLQRYKHQTDTRRKEKGKEKLVDLQTSTRALFIEGNSLRQTMHELSKELVCRLKELNCEEQSWVHLEEISPSDIKEDIKEFSDTENGLNNATLDFFNNIGNHYWLLLLLTAAVVYWIRREEGEINIGRIIADMDNSYNEDFSIFNREEEVNKLFQGLIKRDPTAFLLAAPFAVGKTQLALKIASKLPSCLFINIENITSSSTTHEEIIAQLGSVLGLVGNFKGRDPISSLGRCMNYINRAMKIVKNPEKISLLCWLGIMSRRPSIGYRYAKFTFPEFVQRLFKIEMKETPIFPTLILDEVSRLLGDDIQDPQSSSWKMFKTMINYISNDSSHHTVLISSDPHIDEFLEGTELKCKQRELISLGDLTIDQAETFLKTKRDDLGLKNILSDTTINNIVKIQGGRFGDLVTFSEKLKQGFGPDDIMQSMLSDKQAYLCLKLEQHQGQKRAISELIGRMKKMNGAVPFTDAVKILKGTNLLNGLIDEHILAKHFDFNSSYSRKDFEKVYRDAKPPLVTASSPIMFEALKGIL